MLSNALVAPGDEGRGWAAAEVHAAPETLCPPVCPPVLAPATLDDLAIRFISSAGITLADWRRATAGRERTQTVDAPMRAFALELREAARAAKVPPGVTRLLGVDRATIKRWAWRSGQGTDFAPKSRVIRGVHAVASSRDCGLATQHEVVALRRVLGAVANLPVESARWVAGVLAARVGAPSGTAAAANPAQGSSIAPTLGQLADHASSHEPPGWVTDEASVTAAREVAEWLSAPEWLTPAVGQGGSGRDDEEGDARHLAPIGAVRLDLWRNGGASKPPCDLACVRGRTGNAACPAAMGCAVVARAAKADSAGVAASRPSL